MLLDNVSKAAEPLLVLLCARAYAGGEWGMFKYYESLILLLTRLGSRAALAQRSVSCKR